MNLSTSARAQRGGVFFKLVLFLVVLIGVVVTAWILVLPNLLTSTLKKRTGFDVKINDLTLNPFTGRLHFDGFVISNPSTFARPEFLDIRTVRAEADAASLFSDKPVIHDAEIDVGHISLIRNQDGTLNAALFQERLFPSEPPADPKAKKDEKEKTAPKPQPAKKLNFLIERLTVKFDKVILANYTAAKPQVKEYDLKFSHVYTNVTDPKQLAQPVVQKLVSVVGSAISALIPGDMGKILGNATQSGADSFRETGKKAVTDVLKSVTATPEAKPTP